MGRGIAPEIDRGRLLASEPKQYVFRLPRAALGKLDEKIDQYGDRLLVADSHQPQADAQAHGRLCILEQLSNLGEAPADPGLAQGLACQRAPERMLIGQSL